MLELRSQDKAFGHRIVRRDRGEEAGNSAEGKPSHHVIKKIFLQVFIELHGVTLSLNRMRSGKEETGPRVI